MYAVYILTENCTVKPLQSCTVNLLKKTAAIKKKSETYMNEICKNLHLAN